MNARTDYQVIVGADGKPAFVVIPYEQFRALQGQLKDDAVPNDVVNLAFDRGISSIAAWREHLGLTQTEVASRLGISQAAYAQTERAKRPRNTTLLRVADALGIDPEQLRW